MLIYVLDLFDGGLKPPKPPPESATADAARMLLHINGKFTIRKLK
jgi:hypothetical protein